MADELGAVRRTARPTGDRQTPETGPSVDASATITPSPVSGDHPGVREDGTDDLSPEVAAALIEQHGPELEALADAFHELRGKLHATAVLGHVHTTDNDMQAFLELPDCAACGGTGKDDHGTPFEAPLAVHFAGPYVTIGGRRRQLCAWCGHVLLDVQLAPGQEHEPWFDVKLVRVEDGTTTRQPYTYGDPLPPGCCALPDDGEPTPGPGCYPPADGWDGVSTADVPVDPVDDYPVDLCGKYTGNCSNRCLLPAHHDGECDDDPRPDEAPGCCTACNGNGTVETGYPCEDCYATGHSHAETVSCDGVQAAAGPDEAQETRADDWPAEEPEGGA